jgi:ferredoxin
MGMAITGRSDKAEDRARYPRKGTLMGNGEVANMDVCVDYDRCTGLGVCEALLPRVFSVQDDGRMQVIENTLTDEFRSLLTQVAASCPTQAITITE